MKELDLIGGILWLLGVATVFLLATAVAIAMARDGLVLWEDAKEAVTALSTFSTLLVGAVVIVHFKGSREKEKE